MEHKGKKTQSLIGNMAVENSFKRWETHTPTSWAWRIFKKHNTELMMMYTTMHTAHKYTYQSLKKDGATWEDLPTKHFKFNAPYEFEEFPSLKEWSDSYNALENWVNLNTLVTLSGNLETYIATIVPLALSSDVGVRYGTPHRIDGIEIIKHSKSNPFDFSQEIIDCTKGTWASRINTYRNLFGKVPDILVNNESDLDKIRNIRNEVAHSFGRDIEASRHAEEIVTLPIRKLKREKLLMYQKLIWQCSKAIDEHLYNSHIGEYQSLLFYHELYPTLNHNVHPSMRAMSFKKKIAQHGDMTVKKEFCKGLVDYYENL